MNYAEVAVNSPVGRGTFSYSIPAGLSVAPGQGVWVPFGPRRLQGVVFDLTDVPAVEQTRDIIAVIDPQLLLSPAQLQLCRWISQHYLCSLFEAASLMLPPGFERKVTTRLAAASDVSEEGLAGLSPEQQAVLTWLKDKGWVEAGKLKVEGVTKAQKERAIARLAKDGLVLHAQEMQRPRVKPRLVAYLRLSVAPEVALQEAQRLSRRASSQTRLLELLASSPEPMPAAEAKARASCPQSTVAALVGKGLVVVEQVRLQRDPLSGRDFVAPPAPMLTPAQEAAWAQVRDAIDRGQSQVFLLHGVTGSGKTEIYLRALAETVARGKRGMVLVPEISLTPQTIQRFAARFPGQVAVLHSKLSLGEQFDEWHRIRAGDFQVIIGSRGALFTPQPDLGLIVIDEEHEWTYKQVEPSPRYHARDVALKLADLQGAVVILGSATPDIASYHRARQGGYRLLELTERVTAQGMPQVEVVDMRQELKADNRSLFSRALSRAMVSALDAHEQVILFLNRRGAASFVQCRSCGLVWRCRRCAAPLTYHAVGERLICHQCNYRAPVPEVCPKCGSKHILFKGLGTQRLEQEMAYNFPGARVLRWDRDVTVGRHSHEQILAQFVEHRADVLIGTQMIAKGLDMPLVTLVGIVAADMGLHLPDFRSAERTFQILSQVAGRAGRGQRPGRVVVQTYAPENYAIKAASQHDYAAFYRQEIELRRKLSLPPFSRLARLTFSHFNATACQQRAEQFYRQLKQERDARGIPDLALIGPAPAYMQRLRGRFRWHIILRGAEPERLLAELLLPQGWTVDIDPVGLD